MISSELKSKARTVFQMRGRRGQRDLPEVIDERIGTDIPNGPGTVIRASWFTDGRGQFFALRGRVVDPFGESTPMQGVGIHFRVEQLPALAVLVSRALDDLMMASPVDEESNRPGSAPVSPIRSGRRGGR